MLFVMLVICAYIHIKLRISDQSANTALPLEKEMVERLIALLIVVLIAILIVFFFSALEIKGHT